MRRLLLVGVVVAAVVVPTVLAADPVPSDYKNAAKYCQALRAAKGVEAFQTAYGTNTNKKNAFGKCVSATNKTKAKKGGDEKADDEQADDDQDEAAAGPQATAECKKQQHADAAKFAQDYKNFGQCVKAHKGKKTDESDSDD